MKALIFAIFVCFTIGGCTSPQKKRDLAISTAIFSAKKALAVKRVDLAQKYIEEASRLATPVKRLPKIAAAKTDNGKTDLIILPKDYNKDDKILVLDSPEFKTIIEENTKLKAQIEGERVDVEKFTKKVDNAIVELHNEALKDKKSSFLGWLMASIGGIGLIGTIVLIVFFPAALPIIISFVKYIINWVVSIVKNISEALKR